MGTLVNGEWKTLSIVTSNNDGTYERKPRSFRDIISLDHPIFKPESNRYHLYVSYACPWAHRTLIYRKLKDLENHISISVVHPDMLEDGWCFNKANSEIFNGATKDHLFDFKYLREVYLKADSKITTSVTVPILWDKKTHTIVNNESSEIIRIFNSSFNKLTANKLDFYPINQREKIDEINEKIYHSINNGVYKSGLAKTQKAYEEADLRLIPTLLRFDLVYLTHFKCNIKRIKDYKNLNRYTKDFFEMAAIKETTHLDHIKRHYYYSHENINPYRIIPLGPEDII